MTDENTITTAEQLAALPLGQWIIDAAGVEWALFDTNVLFRQRMWRMKNGASFVAHEGIKLPAGLADTRDGFVCPHEKLTLEGWQCYRCAVVINEPPEPEPQPVPEKGRAWFYADRFGDWIGMSPDFENVIALAQDTIDRPHDAAAKDRLSFETAALMAALRASEDPDDEGLSDGYTPGFGLGLIITHLVAHIARGGSA